MGISDTVSRFDEAIGTIPSVTRSINVLFHAERTNVDYVT